MTHNSLWIAVTCILLFASFQPVQAGDWPFFRGPDRNGISSANLELIDSPVELWRVDNLGTRHRGSPSVVDGKVYINGGRPADRSEPFLHCLDARTGKELWKTRSGRTNSTPAVYKGKVYCAGDRLFVRCFDANNGDLLWKSEPMPESTVHRHYGHAGSPVVWENLLILNYGYGVALDLKSGKEVWKFAGHAGLATPVVFSYRDKPAVAIFCGDKMIARDARTGKELWSIPWVTDYGVNACDPLFVENDSKVFLSSGYGLGRSLYDISSGEPKELWSQGAGATYSSSLYIDRQLYSLAGGFGRLDVTDGKRVSRGPAAQSVLAIGDKFIFLSAGGGLQIGTVSGNNYKELFKSQITDGETWNVPAYWKGRLYVRNQNGVLVCLQIGNEK